MESSITCFTFAPQLCFLDSSETSTVILKKRGMIDWPNETFLTLFHNQRSFSRNPFHYQVHTVTALKRVQARGNNPHP